MEQRSQFWVVWCEDGGRPTVKHHSFGSADREAQRLARENRGRVFFVLVVASGRYLPPPDMPEQVHIIADDDRPF